MLITVKTRCKAMVTETWEVQVPDGFNLADTDAILERLDYIHLARHIGDEIEDEEDREVVYASASVTVPDWADALNGPSKPRNLCRVQGCTALITHVEAAHPDLLDSQRCSEHATPGVHIPRGQVQS